MGVNEATYEPSKHQILSNASCTTNCLAPVIRVLDDAFGVVRGMLLTVHSYTNDQNILDVSHKDLRRSRAASLSQIPTTTGAAEAVGLVIPHLQGKLHGLAIRVPTPNVSLVDLTAELKQKVTKSEINEAFQKQAKGNLQDILGYCAEPLVSIDFNGCQKSATLDSSLTQVIDGNLIKVIAWYDNEVGFSARMLDLTRYLQDRGL
jgi:glyceraldehyde 3-phosphate dehydrogenase